MKERPGPGVDPDFTATDGDREFVERFDRRFCLAFGIPKRREIMLSDQDRSALGHGCGVEGGRHPPNSAAVQCRGRAPVDDAIQIGPTTSRKSGVKFLIHDLGLEHRNGVRFDMEVDRVPDRVRLPVLFEINVGNLTQSMDTGIRAPGNGEAGGFAGKPLDGLLENLLNTEAVVLALPANIGPSYSIVSLNRGILCLLP